MTSKKKKSATSIIEEIKSRIENGHNSEGKQLDLTGK